MMRIERRYTRDGESPYADIAFRLTTSEIRNPDGSVVFRADDVEVPAAWSQVASDLLELEGRLFRLGVRRPRLLRRTPLHLGDADGSSDLAPVVQHRLVLRLRH